MTVAAVPRAAIALAHAVRRVMYSRAWADAIGDPDERCMLVVEGVCEDLHSLGPLQFPSVHMLREALDRDDRDDAIRDTFDGRNYARLARKHRLSTRQVRRILDDERRS